MILRNNTDCFSKQHSPADLYYERRVCSRWGKNAEMVHNMKTVIARTGKNHP